MDELETTARRCAEMADRSPMGNVFRRLAAWLIELKRLKETHSSAMSHAERCAKEAEKYFLDRGSEYQKGLRDAYHDMLRTLGK